MSDERPSLHVVRGEPTAEELAIVTALVMAAGGDEATAPPLQRGRWNDPALTLRHTLHPGPGAWRAG